MTYFPKKQSNPIINLIASINSELGGTFLQVIFEEGGKYRLVLTHAGLKKSELKFITFGIDEALKFREMYMYLLGIINGFRVKSINL